ncbi:hypothetical protein RHECNPAF_930079 [Rhizobium etli CNPAF512]|nr:hypothetical protein RHECNPAF_930079 [Rhizobium etli CNPAF512]
MTRITSPALHRPSRLPRLEDEPAVESVFRDIANRQADRSAGIFGELRLPERPEGDFKPPEYDRCQHAEQAVERNLRHLVAMGGVTVEEDPFFVENIFDGEAGGGAREDRRHQARPRRYMENNRLDQEIGGGGEHREGDIASCDAGRSASRLELRAHHDHLTSQKTRTGRRPPAWRD